MTGVKVDLIIITAAKNEHEVTHFASIINPAFLTTEKLRFSTSGRLLTSGCLDGRKEEICVQLSSVWEEKGGRIVAEVVEDRIFRM